MYEIYLDDKPNNQYAKLDVDTVDMTSVFQVADINDVSKRKDSFTKNLSFKDTQRNNSAFGYSGVLNKYIDESATTNGLLFWSYNPQILVPVYIYENGILILQGTLRHLQTNRNPNGTKSYDCVVTGQLKDFKDMIGDKVLTDLDLSEMTHTFNINTIKYNWNNDPKSMGYVYPLIHNGVPFASYKSATAINTNPFQIFNFRPAVFVSTILDKIFTDSNVVITDDEKTRIGLPYNWKVEGTDEFKEMFSNLIIPNNQAVITETTEYDGTDVILELSQATPITFGFFPPGNSTFFSPFNLVTDIDIHNKLDAFNLLQVGTWFGGANVSSTKHDKVIFNVMRTFKSTANLSYKVSTNNIYPANQPLTGIVYVFERETIDENYLDGYNTWDGWDVIGQDTFAIPVGTLNRVGNVIIPEREYALGRQIRICFATQFAYGSNLNGFESRYQYSFSDTQLRFPNELGSKFITNLGINNTITPTLPTGIKQLDFLNSLRNLFNLYIYTDTDSRTVVFETYDKYYERTKGLEIFQHALDWSGKIDNTTTSTIKTNVDIQKSYEFVFKSDSDYINDFYTKKYNKNFGSLTVTDSKGISDTPKKVELIFSSTPTVLSAPNVFGQGGFSLPIPWIYKLNGDSVAPLDSNIRILHYNGVQTFQNTFVTVITENWDYVNTDYNIDGEKIYAGAMASNFVMGIDFNPTRDLHFTNPNEGYWKRFPSIPTSYSFYQNQFKELRNPNIVYFEGEAYLNENDINQLDLATPIFIDFGLDGHGYWKVLSVNYTNSSRSSTIKLQKVIL